jgi:hypothetical protein
LAFVQSELASFGLRLRELFLAWRRMSDDDDYDAADAGAADCTPIEAGAVKTGKFRKYPSPIHSSRRSVGLTDL